MKANGCNTVGVFIGHAGIAKGGLPHRRLACAATGSEWLIYMDMPSHCQSATQYSHHCNYVTCTIRHSERWCGCSVDGWALVHPICTPSDIWIYSQAHNNSDEQRHQPPPYTGKQTHPYHQYKRYRHPPPQQTQANTPQPPLGERVCCSLGGFWGFWG